MSAIRFPIPSSVSPLGSSPRDDTFDDSELLDRTVAATMREGASASALGRWFERAMRWWSSRRLDLVLGGAVVGVVSLALAVTWWEAAGRTGRDDHRLAQVESHRSR